MIARIWRGLTPAEKCDAYFKYIEQTGLKDYASTPGNRGATILRRLVADRAEFFVLSFWDSWEAIKRFAGEDVEKAVYYPEDDDFLIEKEPRVSHFEVLSGSAIETGCHEKSEGEIQPSYFVSPQQAPKLTQFTGLETTILTGLSGEKMMMVLNATLPGHSVPTHSHPHEQVGIVYAGKARLRIGDEEREASKGDFYCIPANVPHNDTCIGDEPFVMLDIFYPIREDFVAKLAKESQHRP